MKTLIALFVIALVCPVQAFCLDIPQMLQPQVEQALKDGRALYDAYAKGSIHGENAETAKAKVNDFCDFVYEPYAVGKDTYFIAEPPSAGGIVFGRHYRVSEGGVTKSTITCFATPPPPDNAVAAYITHPMSSAPSEFHVFLSLKYKNPIYVRTEVGYWKVQNGRIALMERPK